MKFPQKGFAALEGLLILVIIAIIGGTGYYVWHGKRQTEDSLTSASANSKTGKSTLIDQINNYVTNNFAGYTVDNSSKDQDQRVVVYKLPDYAFSTSAPGDKASSTLFIYNRANPMDTPSEYPANLETYIRNKLNSTGYTEDKSQPGFVYNTSTFKELYFKKDKEICEIIIGTGTKNPLVISCISLDQINSAALKAKPFYEPLKAAGHEADAKFMSLSRVKDSKTPGYRIADVDVDGGTAYFYSKNNQAWTLFTVYGSGNVQTAYIVPCSAYNTPELKAAFEGEACWDDQGNNGSTVQ